ncbi:MAG: metallophosphoesterase [Deltaproteobacteria bacterium]|nr:metallophosphoesterase [Deltaproteobacteria bacterium]
MLRIAHISDLHVLDWTGARPADFASKRWTGALNLLGSRRGKHPVAVAERLADHLGARIAAGDIDHVIVSGDLTNLSLPGEFRRAREVIDRIGPRKRLTLVPGNHDVYTAATARSRAFESHFADLCAADGVGAGWLREAGRDAWPVVRAPLDDVRIYGLCSAVPTPPFCAWGQVGPEQLVRLQTLVAAEPATVRVRIVVLHHNLHRRGRVAEASARLLDRAAVAQAVRDIDAHLVLHGHSHPPHQGHLAGGPGRPVIPVVGCGSSTWQRGGAHGGSYNVVELRAEGVVGIRGYRAPATDGSYESDGLDLLAAALRPEAAISC